MGGVELLQAVAFGAKVEQVLPVLIEFEDMIGRVAIGKKNVAVRSHGNRRRIEPVKFESGFRWGAKLQNNLAAADVELDALGVVVACTIDVLTLGLLPNLHVMNVGVVFS